MKKLFLTLTIASLVVFTSCKENAAEKINQENTKLYMQALNATVPYIPHLLNQKE